jgi:hypothetical protein
MVFCASLSFLLPAPTAAGGALIETDDEARVTGAGTLMQTTYISIVPIGSIIWFGRPVVLDP